MIFASINQSLDGSIMYIIKKVHNIPYPITIFIENSDILILQHAKLNFDQLKQLLHNNKLEEVENQNGEICLLILYSRYTREILCQTWPHSKTLSH